MNQGWNMGSRIIIKPTLRYAKSKTWMRMCIQFFQKFHIFQLSQSRLKWTLFSRDWLISLGSTFLILTWWIMVQNNLTHLIVALFGVISELKMCTWPFTDFLEGQDWGLIPSSIGEKSYTLRCVIAKPILIIEKTSGPRLLFQMSQSRPIFECLSAGTGSFCNFTLHIIFIILNLVVVH